MKTFAAVLFSVLLGVQFVLPLPVGLQVCAEEVAEDTKERDVEENAEGLQDAEQEEVLNTESAPGDGIEISAPSAILMEASTGQVIYERDADTRRPPASVTKIMTLLLIFDAIEDGEIALEDEVQTSEFAASMGGSQVFLEPGEVQTVETMIKCIAVASANDACVAMAEHICGSEEAFVSKMNERAKELGMKNTNFVNCNGLDTDGHETTARDIALMSRELITKHPEIHDYATIWMETITHTTNKGTSEFGLTNTNKLIRQYQYATGLKTGSTGKAKFCVSATAEKNQMKLIAVVLGAEDSKARFKDAVTLLNYGFGKCVKYIDEGLEQISPPEVKGGVDRSVPAKQSEIFEYIDTEGRDLTQIEKKPEFKKSLKAPVKAGDKIGEMVYLLGGKELGRADIIAVGDVQEMNYKHAVEEALERFFL